MVLGNDVEIVMTQQFVVTRTADDLAAGSLRWAINEANSNFGPATIEFDIAGAGPHTIAPSVALPQITEAVTIDGYSETWCK